MSLLTQIKKDQLQARKEGNKVTRELLTVLISDAEMIGKNDGNRETTDTEVIRLIKKYIKTIEENQLIASDVDYIERLEAESILLNNYLPKQLNDKELQDAITAAISQIDGPVTIKHLGLVMKELVRLYEGQFDGKVASTLVRDRLK